MALSYVVTELPPVWPGRRTRTPKRAPFKTAWTKTLRLLERELGHLRARKVELALDLPRGAYDLRQDGMLRADARPRPAVILSFLDADGQRQAYPCDTFGWWQDNVYAIAVVLEDLRRAERYGVQPALLRAGFKALPAAVTPTLSTEQAAEAVSKRGNHSVAAIMASPTFARDAVRVARAKTHPDTNGGATADFQLVQEAARILAAHHGVPSL